MKQLEGKRILLADDESNVLETFSLLLTAHKAVVTAAVDGAQALELYGTGQFDCVLTDYSMPRLMGDALAHAIKTRNPHQRVVMISGFPDLVRVNGQVPWFIDVLLPKPPQNWSDFFEAIAPPEPPVSDPPPSAGSV